MGKCWLYAEELKKKFCQDLIKIMANICFCKIKYGEVMVIYRKNSKATCTGLIETMSNVYFCKKSVSKFYLYEK